MAAASTSATRPGRPRKASTATAHPSQPGGTPVGETPTPSASGGPAPSHFHVPNYSSTGPVGIPECENIAALLVDTSIPPVRKLQAATDLRDTAENTRDNVFYERYLGIFIPALITILSDERHITFIKDSPEHRLRHTLLTFLQRLTRNEVFRPHQEAVLKLMVKLLKVENDENALVCIKIIIEGIRSHKEQAESIAEPFLDAVKQMYQNLKPVVEKEFGAKGSSPPQPPAPNSATTESDTKEKPESAAPEKRPQTILAPALHSPKVLTECPIAVVLIFQTWKTIMTNIMQDFFPLVMESIKIQPEPQRWAYEEAQAKGELHVGVSPHITEGPPAKREMYTELVKTQVKTIAFLAYVLRAAQLNTKDYINDFPEACCRLLRDCPPEDFATRKELLVATRHMLSSDLRHIFVPYVDVLIDERVLIGTGITSREILRPLAYSVIADLIHHVRQELSIAQLSRVVYVFSCTLNDATLTNSIHTMCAKVLNGIVETIYTKADTAEATRLLKSMFYSNLDKLVAITEAYERLKILSAKDNGKGKAKAVDAEGDVGMEEKEDANEKLLLGWREIEKNMPVTSVAYASETLEGFGREARHLFKTLMTTFRTILQCTRQGENPIPQPDGQKMAILFKHSVRGLALYENQRDNRDAKEMVELVTHLHLLIDSHVYSEIWTHHLDFFIEQSMINPQAFPILQVLIIHESVSHQLTSIVLRYLMGRLADFGGYSKTHATLILRCFKISFLAINTYINTNETILVPHLQKLIMRCFHLSAKAEDPTIYYQILRTLFRAIGGGRFEALYKEVLPILQEMLDTLKYLLQHATNEQEQDLFVELTLTVPVRLTNLLPHLSYLMQPLVYALRGSVDQVSQGLRTLELCIDNLTAEFLDPTLTPVLRDLMLALQRLLKPIPGDRKHATSALKILGKLGGRTRRFQEVDPILDYRVAGSEIRVPLTLEGKTHKLPMSSLIESSAQAIEDDQEMYRGDGIQVLQICVMSALQEDGPNAEGNEAFNQAMRGLFMACTKQSMSQKALEFVRDYCRRVFAAELTRTDTRTKANNVQVEIGRKRYLPLTSAVSDCFVDTLSSARSDDRNKLGELLSTIIEDFRTLASGPDFAGRIEGGRAVDRMIQSFAHRFAALCHEEDWTRKLAGICAMQVLVDNVGLSRKLLLDLEIDFIRALFFCLRDAPKDSPRTANDVTRLLKHLIRTCQGQEDGLPRVQKLTETLVLELTSQSELSRTATHECLELLAEVTSQTVPELVGPAAKAKLLDSVAGPIFSKPIRALPFPMQIGNIDAVRYLMALRPPVLESSEALIRLLHEVLALADVDDDQLLNKPYTHKQEMFLKTLRIACLRLLRSAMDAPDFLNTPNLAAVRTRITHVYFKHVYSTYPEVTEAAHEGLRDIMEVQSKLPKDVLQAGLRPILVNLADAKRLSVSGLDGLARFLELMTNYFKVEIGVKLLEHFIILGDPQSLAKAWQSPLEENVDIMRMTRLVDVFRLLPDSAVQYLGRLVAAVVDVEAHLHQSAPGPFSNNLAEYLNKYHVEGAQNLLENMHNPRYVWTYRNVIASGKAPKLVEELSSKTEIICQICFNNAEAFEFVIPGLYLIRELSYTSPSWLPDRQNVLEALVGIWRSILNRARLTKADMSAPQYQEMPPLLLEMFMTSLRHKRHTELLFHLVEAYEIRSSFERSHIAMFLYQEVALCESYDYRREVIEMFFNLYEDESVTWAYKANALRLIVNPTIPVFYNDPDRQGELISHNLANKIVILVDRPLHDTAVMRARDDTLLVEILQMSSFLVDYCATQFSENRKDVLKLAWMGVNTLEPTVKLIAYDLAARFMAEFDSPIKFVKLTWTGLLRLKELENRTLYRKATDALAKTVMIRDPPPPLPMMPEYALRVRTILMEEGHANHQLMTVCELLVNHSDMFYDYRELYVPYIANSLNKLAFVQAASSEHKRLTVDVVELIFKWEKRRMAARDEALELDETASKRKGKTDEPMPSPVKRQRLDRAGTAVSASSGGGWAAPTQVRELITAHLLRLVSSSMEPVPRGGLTKRALDLFKEILGPNGLPNVHVKLSFFTRTMTQDINESTINTVANSVEVIAAVAASRDQTWVRQNLGLLAKLLEKVWVCEDSGLHETISPLTEKLFLELPESEEAEADADSKALLTFVSTTVNEGLVSSLRSISHLPGTLFLLRNWLKVQPQQLQSESISTGLLKVLTNLAKIHTSNGPDSAYRLIISILDVIKSRINDIREQRRSLNAVLSTIVERSTNKTLLEYILSMIRDWILNDTEPSSQGKEKAALLLRMAIFEHRDEGLFQKYLDLIYDIYEMDALRSTELTHRLEQAFLLGTKSKNSAQRSRFLDKLEQSLPSALDARLQYLYALQNWDTLADSYWIPQILSMLLALFDPAEKVIRKPVPKVIDSDPIAARIANTGAEEIITAARNMVHYDTGLAHRLWVSIFPMCWSTLSRAQQTAVTPYIVKLLSKEYNRKQVEMRPNVIQTFLEGILACTPPVTLPPLLVKYLAKTFSGWYSGIETLTRLADIYKGDDGLRDSCSTALSELYAELCEEDMFYGLARSRCVYPETIAALTYEQNGLWPKALEMYEQAQLKARNGTVPFTEEEYCFWEDHWILAAQKVQAWDSLTELARTDQDSDLLLECAWRLSDWCSADRETLEANLAKVADVPTPRRKTFETFCSLLKAHVAREPPNDYLRALDEAQQVTLRKWTSLPTNMTAAHLPLLQMFQQCVELSEAAQVFDSLQITNAQNLEHRVSTDLKGIFQTWRDRMPNFWDDISVWSDLLAWRQHVFQAVTKVYVPLIPQGETATFGYRGYHETAWTINRFGEVARRHGLLDVCSVALNKIYLLPNIEISEAFLKLREQALCYFQKPDKYSDGLDNISTTNLVYFAPAQKAEFLTLKAMFIANLGKHEEANAEFAHAIQMDMNLPKAWAEWGRHNDRLYRDRPEVPVTGPPEPEPGKQKMTNEEFLAKYTQDRAVFASSAVSCYLQAAGLYNNHKSRALLLRVLWLLGLDDSQNTVARAFENYKGDLVTWYWITLIPQLILSLSHREARQARLLLMRIAKQFPQALFYQLRVSKEDFGLIKKQHQQQRAQAARRAAEQAKAVAEANGESSGDKAENKEVKEETPASATVPSSAPLGNPPGPRQPWELVDEIMNTLKTAFPLLTLTMEKMVDQISLRAKPASDEDIYRFFAALLADALLQYGNRSLNPNDDGELTQSTKDNLVKFSSNLSGDLKLAIEKDFMRDTPRLREYIRRLQSWRDNYERGLDARPRLQALDSGGCNLIEFHQTKFDEVEVPGQYIHHVDQSEEFAKIARFYPKAELARGHGHCFRRLTMIGSNGKSYTFNVQLPAARHCRREERLTQLFRIMNSVLRRRTASRRRNLQFHLPAAIPLAPQLRLVENDASYISLQDIYDDYCASKGRCREDSIMTFYDRVKQLYDPAMPTMQKNDPRFNQLKAEVMEEIQAKMVPENILSNYMIRTMSTPESLWIMRKQFALQTAAVNFLTYVCCLNNRAPNRFHLSRKTGLMYMTEILPAFAGAPMIQTNESLPFRLTPNMQHFITRVGVEGVVTAATSAIARSLTQPEFDLAPTLHLFIRDELLTWLNTYMKEPKGETYLNKTVFSNVNNFVRRAYIMGSMGESSQKDKGGPVFHHNTVSLISQATSPLELARMSEIFMPWY